MTRRIMRLLGYGLSAACIVILAISVDWSRFIGDFRTASLIALISAIPLVALTYLLFALRWRILLSIAPKPSILRMFKYLMLGYLANVMLPMRAGDALRVALIRMEYGHGTARAVSSIVLERVLDVLTLLAMGAMLAFHAHLPEPILVVLRTAAVVTAVALAMIIAMAVKPSIVTVTLEAISRRLDGPHARTFATQGRQFVEAIGILVPRDRDSVIRAASAVTCSLAGWACYAFAMSMCVAGFGVRPAPVSAALLLVVVTNLGSAIPSSPASLGVYHALGVIALSPWHLSLDLALSIATVTHAITVGVQIVLALFAMVSLPMRRQQVSSSALSNRGG